MNTFIKFMAETIKDHTACPIIAQKAVTDIANELVSLCIQGEEELLFQLFEVNAFRLNKDVAFLNRTIPSLKNLSDIITNYRPKRKEIRFSYWDFTDTIFDGAINHHVTFDTCRLNTVTSLPNAIVVCIEDCISRGFIANNERMSFKGDGDGMFYGAKIKYATFIEITRSSLPYTMDDSAIMFIHCDLRKINLPNSAKSVTFMSCDLRKVKTPIAQNIYISDGRIQGVKIPYNSKCTIQ